MLALYPLSRWPRYAQPAADIVERPAMLASHAESQAVKAPPTGQGMAFFPYILLTVLALGISMIDPINDALGSFTVGLPFPEVATGYGITNAAAMPYSALVLLTPPGASLVVTALVTWGLYRARGYYNVWAATTKAKRKGVLRGLF